MKATRIAAVAAIAVFAVAVLINIFQPLPESWLIIFNDSQQALFGWFAFICTLTAASKFAKGEAHRKVWAFLAIGVFLWTLGDTTWWIIEVLLRQKPFPYSLADYLWLTGYPVIFCAFAYGLKVYGTKPTAVSVIVSIALGTVIALNYFFFLLMPIAAGAKGLLERLVLLGYPAGDALLLLPIVFTLLTLRHSAYSRIWQMIAIGILLQALGDSFYSYFAFYNIFESGTLVDLSWVASYLVIGLASLSQIEKAVAPAINNKIAA